MEVYILSKHDLSILSIGNVTEYEINLDEETNAKSTFKMIKTEGLEEGNYVVVNGLYRQFLFVIPSGGIEIEKSSNIVSLNVVDIANIFNRKVIEKNIELMENKSIEEFIANTIDENFVNSNDVKLNVGYIDIDWHTRTKGNVETEAENGLYNFHTFLVNCRQKKNIDITFKFENKRLKIDIEKRVGNSAMIDTTLPEVTEYNKIYEEEVTAKVQVYVREDGSEYNLYRKTDRTTTTDKNDPDRATGKIEVISVDKLEKAEEEANNIMKNSNYKHLVEFKIAKTSMLMDVTKLYIGRPVRIKTEDDIYNSYISAITIKDENYIYFKSGNLRNTLLDKLKGNKNIIGNKLDKTGGIITGDLNITGNLTVNDKEIANVGIYESGNNSKGRWIKFSDGTMIVTQTKIQQDVHTYVADGTIFRGNLGTLPDFPVTFIEAPIINLTLTNAFKLLLAGQEGKTTTKRAFDHEGSPAVIGVHGATNFHVENVVINLIAIGKWK